MPRAHHVAIPLKEGKRLTDWFGISQDLLACRDYILLYKSLCQTEHSQLNHKLTDCVVTTVFIRYGRALGSGIRSPTQEELKQTMTDADRNVHQLAMDFRDKHFAHSVNNCESPEVTVSLTTDSPDRRVTSVSVGSTNVLAPDMFVFDNLLILIDKLREWAISEQKAESRRLLPVVQQRYSLDDLYARIGQPKRKKMTYGDVSKARKGV
jgi:hypothetical protein